MLQRRYLLHNAKFGDELINEGAWVRTVFPGSIIKMSVIMDKAASIDGGNYCPKAGCSGLGMQEEEQPTFRTW